jgi:hypothetical protein
MRDKSGLDRVLWHSPKTIHVKRLQHVADTMCQMYCGWRLIESKPNLVNLGSGTLEIDAITGQSLFQGKSIDQPKIAEEIRAWLRQDLATNKIPVAVLTGARLAVKLSSFRGALERTHEGDFLFGWKSRTHGKNESMRYGV